MIIKTNYDSLNSMLTLMRLVTSCNKSLQEDHKLINFFVKDNKLYGLSTDAQIYCLNPLEGEFDLEGEDNPFMVLYIKELVDILSKYSSLNRTTIKEIQLQTQQKGVVMTITEGAKVLKDSDNFEFSDMYKSLSVRYKLSRANVMNMVLKELPTMVMPTGYTEIKSKDFSKYLEYLYPPMTKPRDKAVMHFNNEFVYSVMGNVYGIAMPNNLPKNIFTEVSMALGYVNFFKNVIPMNDTFKIFKDIVIVKRNRDNDSDDDYNIQKTFMLYIQSGETLIKYKGIDTTMSVSTDSFKQSIQNTVEVDKPYFIDVLKRLDGSDQVYIEVNIKEDENIMGKSTAEFILKTTKTRQRIPVKCAHGSGEFKFMLRPESLGLMAFSHLTKDIDGNSDKVNDLIFYMDWADKGSVSLTCRDKTDDWQARYPRAPYKEAPQLDF